MMRTVVITSALALVLAGCGGGNRASAPTPAETPVNLFATGPIQKACIEDRRKAASRARCGCIQAVANQTLSNADQRRGAKFFKNPARLQEVRQSDNPSHERFWKAWKAYGVAAAELCEES